MNLAKNPKTGMSEGFCIIKSVEKKLTAKNQPYLDLMIMDSEGEMSAKLWFYDEAKYGTYKPNMLIKVRGVIDLWNEKEQLKIENIRKATQEDNVDIANFVPCSPYSGEWMFGEITEIVNNFEDEDLKRLVLRIINDNKENMLIWPAAVKLHHAMRGGLLYHTLSIVRMSQKMCEIYPFVDRELLLSGAILHDIAKIGELEVEETGIANGYSTDGMLLGHIVKGILTIEKAADELKTPHELMVLLEHMILSHHGEPDFGSPIRPMFIEAEILSTLDELDAKIYEMADALKDVKVGEFSPRQWELDQRKLYHHSRMQSNNKVNL